MIPPFTLIFSELQKISSGSPDARYIYTMTELPETPQTGVVAFVVDASEEIDLDGNGVIGPV